MKFNSIMKKDLKIMTKDPSALVVLFLLPIMFISVMSFALSSMYSDDKSIKVMLFDQDQTQVSRVLEERLGQIKGIKIVTETPDGNKLTADEAKKQVEAGKYPALLEIPTKFADNLMAGNKTTLNLFTDPAQAVTADMVEQIMSKVSDGVSVQFSKLSKEAKATLDQPLVTLQSSAVGGDKVVSKPDAFQQNVPAYTVMFAFFSVMFAGRSFLSERSNGTFARVLAAPIDRWSLFLGKMLPYFCIGLVQVITMFSIGHFVFGMGLGNSMLGLIMISVCLVWASSCLGMMIAALFRTESQINGFSVMIVLTMAALGGTMVPLFVMPQIMQKVALITPHAWALTAYQDILVRGLGVADVWLNAVVLLGFGLVFLTVSIWRMRFE